MKRQQWDNLYNEGGEGYNPIPSQPSTLTMEQRRRIEAIGARDRLLEIMAGTSLADPRYADLQSQLVLAERLIASEDARAGQ